MASGGGDRAEKPGMSPSCDWKCDLLKEQLLELWLIHRVESVCGREAVGSLWPSLELHRERRWPVGLLCSVSEAKGSLDFPWQLQLWADGGSRCLLEVGWCPRNLREVWEKQSGQRVPSEPSLLAQSSGTLGRGRISKENTDSCRTHSG